MKPAALDRRHLLLPPMVGPNLIIWRHQLTFGRLHSCTSKAAWGQHCVLPRLTDIMLAAGYSASMSSTSGRPPARDEDGAAAAAAAATSTSAATSGAGCTHLTSLHMPEAFVLCCRQCTLKVRAHWFCCAFDACKMCMTLNATTADSHPCCRCRRCWRERRLDPARLLRARRQLVPRRCSATGALYIPFQASEIRGHRCQLWYI